MTMNAEDLAEDLNLGPTVLDDGAPGWAVLAGYIRDTVDLDEVEQLVRPGDGPLGWPWVPEHAGAVIHPALSRLLAARAEVESTLDPQGAAAEELLQTARGLASGSVDVERT